MFEDARCDHALSNSSCLNLCGQHSCLGLMHADAPCYQNICLKAHGCAANLDTATKPWVLTRLAAPYVYLVAASFGALLGSWQRL